MSQYAAFYTGEATAGMTGSTGVSVVLPGLILFVAAGLAIGTWPHNTSGEDPDDGKPIDEAVAARLFDNVVFSTRSAEAAERELDLYVQQEIAAIDFVCDLTEAQKKKLLLAGRSAVKKIGDRVDDRRREVRLVRAGEFDAVKRRIQADATPLRDVLRSDPLHAESIFWKIGAHVLTPEQAVRMRLYLGTDRIRGVSLHATPFDGRHPIRKIRFPATPFDDGNLARVADVTSLQGLVLSATHVTDSGLLRLARLTNLEELDLGDTRINGSGFVHIRELKRLRDIDLRRTRMTDEGVFHLRNLKEITHLQLEATAITDSASGHLKALPALTHLYLGRTAITDASLINLGELSKLRCLDLGGTRITDDGISHLSRLTNLEVLDLRNSDVTEAGIDSLRGLPHLRHLYLFDTNIDDESVDRLPSASPALKVFR